MNTSKTSHPVPTPEEIAACAYEFYEREGRAEGHDLDHWLAAEAQLAAGRVEPARSATATARSAPALTPKPASPIAPLVSAAPRASTRQTATRAR